MLTLKELVSIMAFRSGQKYEKYKMKTRIKIRIQKLTYVSRELYFQLTKLKLIKNKKFEWRRKKLESRLPPKNESRDRKRKSNVTFRFHI